MNPSSKSPFNDASVQPDDHGLIAAFAVANVQVMDPARASIDHNLNRGGPSPLDSVM